MLREAFSERSGAAKITLVMRWPNSTLTGKKKGAPEGAPCSSGSKKLPLRLGSAFLHVRVILIGDQAALLERVAEVGDAANEVAVIRGVGFARRDLVGDGAFQIDANVGHAAVATGDDDGGVIDRVGAVVVAVGRSVDVGIRKPADVAHQI